MSGWYEIFYWLTVADGVKHFFDVTSSIFTIVAVFSFIAMVIGQLGKSVVTGTTDSYSVPAKDKPIYLAGWEMFQKYASRTFYVCLTLSLITWMGFILTPTKKDCLLIVAGGAVGNFMSTDSSAKALPADVAKFLHVGLQKEIASLTETERAEIGAPTKKDRLIEKAKAMTKEELIKYIEADTSLVK